MFVGVQTASGKTFTMEGPDIDDPTLRGITPRVVDTVFEKIEASPPSLDFTLKVPCAPRAPVVGRCVRCCHCIFRLLLSCTAPSFMTALQEATVWCAAHALVCVCVRVCAQVSMVEIYLEKLRDLLDATRDNLDIRESKDAGIYVEGMSEHFVTSPAEVYATIRQGSENRATASTNMNRDSSRSHSVFILCVPAGLLVVPPPYHLCSSLEGRAQVCSAPHFGLLWTPPCVLPVRGAVVLVGVSTQNLDSEKPGDAYVHHW